MKLEYISINQKGEEFYLTKMKAIDLLKKLDFHFRQAYTNDHTDQLSVDRYLKALNKKGIFIKADKEGIQRRLQLPRIKEITEYLKNSNSFFPNCVILSVNIEDESYDDIFITENNVKYLNLNDNCSFQIIDGQHRLAGLCNCDDDKLKASFEVPIVLFINATKNLSAKIFVDVNGNQKTVNSSVICDLYELYPEDPQFEKDKILHFICRKLNEEKTSPLYRHVKMLGIGRGSVSQAFLVSALNKCFIDSEIGFSNIQKMYEVISFYLKAYQIVFSNVWPVLEEFTDDNEFWNYSDDIMKNKKSQLLKTNGLGGILKAFPKIYAFLGEKATFQDYFDLISQLSGKIDWCNDSLIINGTGESKQDKIRNEVLKILKIK